MNDERRRDPFGLAQAPASRAPDGLWQAVAGELDHGRSAAHRTAWPAAAAAAAALALALAVPLLLNDPDATSSPAAGSPTALTEAQWRSALLERRIDALDDRAVSAASLERIVWLESELRWLDEMISADPERVDLWRQRNELLGEMGQRYAMNDWQAGETTLAL